MRTPEEKEKIVKRYLNGESAISLTREFNLSIKLIYRWIDKYNRDGYEGSQPKIGKTSAHHKNMGLYLRKPKNKIEELELEIMKKDIESARLKKGYVVKGGGVQKEYVTTFDKNTK